MLGRDLDAEVLARVRRRFRSGEAAVDYVRTRTTVLGEPGPVGADGLTATLSGQFGPVRVAVAPSLFRVGRSGSESTVRRIASGLAWRLTRALSVVASHQFTLQRGGIGVAQPARGEIAHNVFQVGLAAPSAAR